MNPYLGGVTSVLICAALAWLPLAMRAPWLDYWGWFAVLLAFGVVNALTISPRQVGEEGPGPRVAFMALPSTHAQHLPKWERFREPQVVVVLAALVAVVIWLVVRRGLHAS